MSLATLLQPCIPRYLAIFFPIFCDVAKVMIIPRKILAKYGYMLNIKYFFKKTCFYISGYSTWTMYIYLTIFFRIFWSNYGYWELPKILWVSALYIFNFPFWICIANHTPKRLEVVSMFFGGQFCDVSN
jgi:hypothetical protein